MIDPPQTQTLLRRYQSIFSPQQSLNQKIGQIQLDRSENGHSGRHVPVPVWMGVSLSRGKALATPVTAWPRGPCSLPHTNWKVPKGPKAEPPSVVFSPFFRVRFWGRRSIPALESLPPYLHTLTALDLVRFGGGNPFPIAPQIPSSTTARPLTEAFGPGPKFRERSWLRRPPLLSAILSAKAHRTLPYLPAKTLFAFWSNSCFCLSCCSSSSR